jgi:hypothetical protein
VFGRAWALSRGQVLLEVPPCGGDDHVNPRGATTSKLGMWSTERLHSGLVRPPPRPVFDFNMHSGHVYTGRRSALLPSVTDASRPLTFGICA